ncbi:alpha/beta fold hydrolase, partial [Rhizobium sp. EC-SD404]|uniref:alpha/beta fold hydrolase n=1 Tax=Rhizobium sp. EC-SD404 TaxID=2038389 RepID=UPI00125FF0DC
MADRNSVAIAPGAVATDINFVQAMSAKPFDTLNRAELEALANSFRGRFLDDLSLPRCPNFEAWRIAHANELEILHLKALRRLVETLSANEPDTALRYAQELHGLAPEEPELSRMVDMLAKSARTRSVSGPPPAIEPTPPLDNARDAEDAVQMVVRDCTTRDGVRVAYAMTGSGPPMVRAAHWMSHLRFDTQSPVWRHWIRELSARNTLIRYDERGNGMSQWDVEDISFDAMVADLESIVDAAGYDKVVLLGVSQGCAISVAYAVRHPERVRGLALYGGYVKGWRARGDPEEIRLREAMATLMRQGWGSDDPVFRQVFTSTFIPGATREQMDWYNELQRMTVTPENAYRLAESFADIDVTDLLGRVAVPTLVMHAKGDRVVPIASGCAFASGIPNARYVELESNNHILLESEPAFTRFIDNLKRFADEVTAPARQHAIGSAKRPISVLVADFSSTEIGGSDSEALAAAIDPLMDGVIDLATAQGGIIFEIRDGLVAAAFGADRALEEHAVRACRAALSIFEKVMREAGSNVALRVAIDSGEAFIREAPGVAGALRISGAVTKDAIELASVLDRNMIALTARARESAGGFVSATPTDVAASTKLSSSGPIFELIAENRALSRWHLRMRQGLTPLVGRVTDLEALSTAWQRAREGEAQMVAVIGEAGVGKSRLVHEFVGSLGFKAVTIIEAGAEEINETVSHELVRR